MGFLLSMPLIVGVGVVIFLYLHACVHPHVCTCLYGTRVHVCTVHAPCKCRDHFSNAFFLFSYYISYWCIVCSPLTLIYSAPGNMKTKPYHVKFQLTTVRTLTFPYYILLLCRRRCRFRWSEQSSIDLCFLTHLVFLIIFLNPLNRKCCNTSAKLAW